MRQSSHKKTNKLIICKLSLLTQRNVWTSQHPRQAKISGREGGGGQVSVAAQIKMLYNQAKWRTTLRLLRFPVHEVLAKDQLSYKPSQRGMILCSTKAGVYAASPSSPPLFWNGSEKYSMTLLIITAKTDKAPQNRRFVWEFNIFYCFLTLLSFFPVN